MQGKGSGYCTLTLQPGPAQACQQPTQQQWGQEGTGRRGSPVGQRGLFLFIPEATVLSTSGSGTTVTIPAGHGGDFTHLQSIVN